MQTSQTLEKPKPKRAIIAVADITPPSGRGKSYTVHSVDGNAFSIWPEKLGLIRSGEQYEITFTETEADSGRIYFNITGTPRHLGPYRASAKPQPQPQPKNGSTKMTDYWQPKPRDPADQKQIWVCALLCRDMEGRAAMTKEELYERGRIHAEVWEELFGTALDGG